MKAHELAQKAADILKQRGTDNGYDAGEERSAATIAKVYNLITGHELTEADAWMFLIVLKLVREGRKHQLDNLLDLSNYALLRAESLQPELCEDEGCPHHGTPHVCVSQSPKPTGGFVSGQGWKICDSGTVHVPKITSTDGDETEGGKTNVVAAGVLDEHLAAAVRAEIIKAQKPGGLLHRRIATFNHPSVK